MQAQEIFNTVAEHLFTQGAPAKDSAGNCMYRGPNGTKCAVGVLIPDEMYDEVLEDQDGYDSSSIYDILNGDRAKLVPVWFREHEDLLSQLQVVHDWDDNWFSTISMQSALRKVALKFRLKDDVLWKFELGIL